MDGRLNWEGLKLRGLKRQNANLEDWNDIRWNLKDEFCILAFFFFFFLIIEGNGIELIIRLIVIKIK